jgi:hypothetical protein
MANFTLIPLKPGALDPLWPVLEMYPEERRNRLGIIDGRASDDNNNVIWLRPGEPIFEHFQGLYHHRVLEGKPSVVECSSMQPPNRRTCSTWH